MIAPSHHSRIFQRREVHGDAAVLRARFSRLHPELHGTSPTRFQDHLDTLIMITRFDALSEKLNF